MLDVAEAVGVYTPPRISPGGLRDLCIKLVGSIFIVLAMWILLVSVLVVFG